MRAVLTAPGLEEAERTELLKLAQADITLQTDEAVAGPEHADRGAKDRESAT